MSAGWSRRSSRRADSRCAWPSATRREPELGAEVVVADYGRPETLAAALGEGDP